MMDRESDVEFGSATKIICSSKPVESYKLNMYTSGSKNQIKLSNHIKKNTDQVVNKLLESGTLYG